MRGTAPTTQKNRPIAFVLSSGGGLSAPVMLNLRPEELTRSEPTRATIHQTLGRTVQGWVDNFGAGLPSVTIAGHTGWRPAGVSMQDGAAAFEALHNLVVKRYNEEKQKAIDGGKDPESVKLIIVDMLDLFCWSVVPMVFQLRRSKSRPLLYQYTIQMQAVEIGPEPAKPTPPPSPKNWFRDGLKRLEDMLGTGGALQTIVDNLPAILSGDYEGTVFTLANKAGPYAGLVRLAAAKVMTEYKTNQNSSSSRASALVNTATELSNAGSNIMRSMASSVAKSAASGGGGGGGGGGGTPGGGGNPGGGGGGGGGSAPVGATAALAKLNQAAGTFNEVRCLMQNALSADVVYNDYSDLYGASNCSSTTGGRPPSPFEGQPVLEKTLPAPSPVQATSDALFSLRVLSDMDPVLAPLPLQEIERHMDNVIAGMTIV